MKILVVSDSHGNRKILEDLKEKYVSKVDYFVHCGDSELNSSEVPEIYEIVEGNCDRSFQFKEDFVIPTAQGNILIVHGHLYGVNYGLNSLNLLAQEKNAKYIFYGHTHVLAVEYIGGKLFLNPGSVWVPRGNYQDLGGTYAIVDVSDNNITIDYYTRTEMAKIPELHFEYQR